MESRVILPGVDRYRVMDAWFEGLRVVLSFRGAPWSPDYIQGISGGAFRIAGPCPCAPTCCHRYTPNEFAAKVLGYQVTYLPLHLEGMDVDVAFEQVRGQIKAEIYAGRPVLLWHAFTLAEWDVVCGFDEEQNLFYGRGSYRGLEDYASEAMRRNLTVVDTAPNLGAILIGESNDPFDAAVVERDALADAVLQARTSEDRCCSDGSAGEIPWAFRKGLGCYDWWINCYRSNPLHVPNMGERYCLGVFSSTHRSAAGFLQELAAKYPRAEEPLCKAAGFFDVEAQALGECLKLLFPNFQIPPAGDPQRSASAASLLVQAQEAFRNGIDEIERVLDLLEY